MDKAELIEQLGALESQIAQDEADLGKWQEKRARLARNRTSGLAVLVIALLLLFATSWWLLAGFIGLVGLLTLLTALANLGKANELVKLTQGRIITNKGELAKLRAQLVA